MQYVGPEARPYRTITDLTADDSDWENPAVAEPASGLLLAVPTQRVGSGAAVTRMVFSFRLVDDDGVQIAGGTATLRPYYVLPATAHGLAEDARSSVQPISDALAAYDLADPLVVTVTGAMQVVLRVTDLADYGAATELRIAAQEMA